jgi:GAF domain
MISPERVRVRLGQSMSGADTPHAAADQLCHACVDLLDVDGASISLMYEGTTRGTFGSSGDLGKRLDELQFTYGEGPCLDAVRDGAPVLIPDFDDPLELRWPAFAEALLASGVRAVFALPIAIARDNVGALDLFRRARGALSDDAMAGGLWAAELAALPLLDLMTAALDWDSAEPGAEGWQQLASLERVEVYQATGMIVGALEVGPVEALVRLRAHAIAVGQTASEVAWAIIERRLTLDSDGWRRDPRDPRESQR